MFFILSKIFWSLAQPLSLAGLILIFSIGLTVFGRRRLAMTGMALATLIIALFGFTSFSALIMGPLEERFARPEEMPAKVDTIIVLGGGFDGRVSAVRHNQELLAAGDRFVEALRLARLYPEARILVTGGFGSLIQEGETDAVIAKRFYEGMGISPERLLFEGQSRNTEENAQMTREMINAQPGDVQLLVTSAFHMPRSIGLFRAAGLDVVAWPTDYRTTGEGLWFDTTDPVENLRVGSTALREWLGLLAYKLTGKIADWFPAP
jgi:uncharacterized SAM-binding protein YcdF (DUF218 family)